MEPEHDGEAIKRRRRILGLNSRADLAASVKALHNLVAGHRDLVPRALADRLAQRAAELQAKGIQIAAVSESAIRDAERGKQRIRPDTLFAIAIALGFDTCEPLLRIRAPANGATDEYLKLPPARITLLRSGELPYTRSICHGFVTQLEKQLGRPVELNEKPGLTEPITHPDWQTQVEALLQTVEHIGGCDYYVPVGTQAAQVLRRQLADQFGMTPFIFLGVTYPKESGLLHTHTGGSEPWEVTGVNYGKGLEDIAVILYFRVFEKRRKLCFIYEENIPQDAIAAQKLRESPLSQVPGRLEVRGLRHSPSLADMTDVEVVYFSWYTFERLFETCKGRAMLSQRLAIATTRDNVAFGHTAVGVSVDDREIGRLGAELLLQHHAGQCGVGAKVNLGSQPVLVPEFRYWIHEGVAKHWRRAFKCRLSEAVLRGAAEVFRPRKEG
jgi:hypothetical protein